MPLDSVATWQVVQEHRSLPDIFKFQVYNIREFALEGGLINIRALSTRLCFILYYSEAHNKVTSRLCGSEILWVTMKLEAFIAFDHFSPPKMDS